MTFTATTEGKKKASKNTANCASSKNNNEDCVDLFRELEIKNLVDESETPKSFLPETQLFTKLSNESICEKEFIHL